MLLLSFLLVSANADMLRLEGGIGMYNAGVSGDAKYKGNDEYSIKNDIGLSDKDTNVYAWAIVKHFVPVVPNFKIEYFNFSTSGKAEKAISWGGHTQTVSAKSELNLSETDLIFYYNLLDNTFWLTLDLGLDAKMVKGDFSVGDEKSDMDFVLPLPYARVRANVPTTSLGLEASLKYLKFKGNGIQEFNIKADYVFDVQVVDLGLEVGYRNQKISVDADDEVEGEIIFSGMFAGFVAKF